MAKPQIHVELLDSGIPVVMIETKTGTRQTFFQELAHPKDLRRLARKLEKAATILEVRHPALSFAAKAARR